MSYNTNPNAAYIQKFAKRMEGFYQRQDKLDEQMWRLYRMMEALDVQEPAAQAGKTKIKPLRAGFAGIAMDRDVAGLALGTFVAVRSRSTKPEDKKHANQLLEPWFQGVFRESQVGDVVVPQIRDMGVLGRGWSNFAVLPRLWAEPEFENLIKELQALQTQLSESDDKGKDKELREQIQEKEDAIADWKSSNFPLRWTYCSARKIWPLLSRERYLPEVIEKRRMRKDRIVEEWGKKAIPDARVNDSDSSEIDVLTYTNWEWTKTMVSAGGSDGEGRIVHEWNHKAGMSPYILMETNADYDAADGIVWKSRLYDFKDMLETLNEILSDMRHIHRRWAEVPLVSQLNPEARGEMAAVAAGGMNKIDISPDENNIIRLLPEEKMDMGPVPTINSQSLELLNFAYEYCMQIVLNPTLQGLTKSGQSARLFEAAKGAAKQNLGPYRQAIQRAYKHWARLAAIWVRRLNERFPKYPDPVVIVDEKYGEIAVKPKDLAGWDAYVNIRVAEPGPVSESQRISHMVGAMNLPLDPQFVLENWGGIENAEEHIGLYYRHQIREMLMQHISQMTLQHAGVLAERTGAGSTANLAAEIEGLQPEELFAMAQGGNAEAQQALGAARQVAPNVRRGGTMPQNIGETGPPQVEE